MMPHPVRLLALGLAVAGLSAPAAAQSISWLSQSQPQSAQYPAEMAAIDAIGGDGFTVQRSEFQVLGINLADALRTASQGSFNVVSTQIGSAAKDDAFLEGIDLIGVATDLPSLREAVSSYRDAFNARLEERFGVRAVAVWPFGPQIFFCNEPIETLDDLEGMRVRSFTASMSTLLSDLGADPVTLSFPEVYPALERGIASCGVTSPTSANTGKWPEVTTHVLPLSVSGAVQAHLVNVEWWEGLDAAAQAKLTTHFEELEAGLWALAETTNNEALDCTVGGACEAGGLYAAYDLTLVDVRDADVEEVRAVSQNEILGEWAGRCEATHETCRTVWNDTIGAALGVSIPAE